MAAADSKLLQGFIDGDRRKAVRLVGKIRPIMRYFLVRHHQALADWHDEIQGAAEVRLFEWRVADPCMLSAQEPLAGLAERAVRQEARREERYRSARGRAAEDAPERPFADPEDEADAGVHLREVTAALRALPEGDRAVLLTQRQHQVGDGAPLQAVLDVSPEAARKRLQRAREAFLQSLIARGLADGAKESP